MKRYAYIFLAVLITWTNTTARNTYNNFSDTLSELSDTTLLCRFSFDNVTDTATTVTDESGNDYVGTLKNGAAFSTIDGIGGVLNLGSAKGYLDLGAAIGSNLISKLQDFTISTYIYTAADADNTSSGNCVFTFGNSDSLQTYPKGCMYFSSRVSRYAICTTNRLSEKGIQTGKALTKGLWKHIAITYTGITAKLYIDGALGGTHPTLTIAPKILGATTYNYIGKSSYATDAYLAKTHIDDFRIYNVALPDSMISILASSLSDYNVALAKIPLKEVLAVIPLKDGQEIISNLSLPTYINGIEISWSSSDSGIISPSGVVNRPLEGLPEKNVTLFATAIKDTISVTKQFHLVVLPIFSDSVALQYDADSLKLSSNIKCLYTDLTLPTSGVQGSVITWISDNPTLFTDEGKLLYRPITGPVKVILTATLTHGNVTRTMPFEIFVAKKDDFSAYLFVYFTPSSESIRFAISNDGYNYKALNHNNPVINSSIISTTGGVRDPHIMRGIDSFTYYMVVTDLCANCGGGYNNKAIILMKSTDLINWQSSVVNIASTYSQFANITHAWAPQTIYDKVKGKYMIYWSIRIGDTGKNKIYYAYANTDFTALETDPELLFEIPDGGEVIDADIIEKDSMFHMFFKYEGRWEIGKAVASTLTGAYTETDLIFETPISGEGSCAFRLINSENYIMMIDGTLFTRSTDLINFKNITSLTSMNFTARHGTVMTITQEEKERLEKQWGAVAILELNEPAGSVISTVIYQINGVIAGKDTDNLKNGIYIRKRIYENGEVDVDKISINK